MRLRMMKRIMRVNCDIEKIQSRSIEKLFASLMIAQLFHSIKRGVSDFEKKSNPTKSSKER